MAEPTPNGGHGDGVTPFILQGGAFRGRVARLDDTVNAILSAHDYPVVVARMLGEAVVLAALLADSLKYHGYFTLQTQGDGPIGMMVADVTSDGDVRGTARWNEELMVKVLTELDEQGMAYTTPHLLGAGHLAFTVDQGPNTDRYQGVVPLIGKTIDEVAHFYFKQSEQLETAFRIHVAFDEAAGRWHAGGLMLQRMPLSGSAPILLPEEADEAWRTALILLTSLTEPELVDPALPPEQLLFRLYNAENLEAFAPKPLRHKCRCSADKVEGTLKSFPRAEIEEMKVDGKVSVKCEFCGASYDYDDAALDRLFTS